MDGRAPRVGLTAVAVPVTAKTPPRLLFNLALFYNRTYVLVKYPPTFKTGIHLLLN